MSGWSREFVTPDQLLDIIRATLGKDRHCSSEIVRLPEPDPSGCNWKNDLMISGPSPLELSEEDLKALGRLRTKYNLI